MNGDDAALVGGVIAATAAFLVAGLFEYNFGDTEVLLAAVVLMAVPFAIDERRDRWPEPGALPAGRVMPS